MPNSMSNSRRHRVLRSFSVLRRKHGYPKLVTISTRDTIFRFLGLENIILPSLGFIMRPTGNQPWIFTGRTNVKAEAPILWPPDVNNWLTGKEPDAGKDWRQEEKGVTEDEMVGCHHWLDGREFEQTLGDSEGQGSPACCSPWSHKELGMT